MLTTRGASKRGAAGAVAPFAPYKIHYCLYSVYALNKDGKVFFWSSCISAKTKALF